MTSKIIAIFSFLAVLATPATAVRASHSFLDTNEKNYAPSVADWTEEYDADVLNNGVVRLDSNSQRTGYVWTDVSVSSKHEGDWIVFASFTQGHQPYLYGYFMDGDEIVSYLSDDTRYSPFTWSTRWGVRFATDRIPDDVDTVRLFLKQASREGVKPDGQRALFFSPGLFIVDDYDDAEKIVDEYEEALDELPDEIDGRVAPVRDDDDEGETDYPVGTLLKCSGEPDVYSMTASNTLKLYPDEDTFYAWGKSFLDVKTISCSKLDDYRVSGEWTYERASYLVKFYGHPAVFTLDNGKYLRLIPNESTARAMYGRSWTSKIREFPISQMDDYYYSVPHRAR
jgi:hypothetical protein